jgi:hypothetical protein
MLKDIFLAPGYFFYRKFSKKRKKFRYVSKNFEIGSAVRISLLFWLALIFIVTLAYASLSGDSKSTKELASPGSAVAPYPSALPPDELQAEVSPPPQSMAESARITGEVAPPLSSETVQNPSGGTSVSAPSNTINTSTNPVTLPSSSSPTPLVVPPELRTTGEILRAPEAWLVIVASSPKSDRDKVEADRDRHKRRGLELEIFDTDAYPLLKSGMWTLALGPFDTRAEAEATAKAIQSKVKETMVRRGL